MLHMTKNVNLAFADLPANAQRVGIKPHSGNAIKFTGSVLVEGASREADISSQWDFGFLQFTFVMVYESEYRGAKPDDGSIAVDWKRAFSPNPCLDANRSDPFFPIAFDALKVKRAATGSGMFQVSADFGDNPGSWPALVEENTATHAKNYLSKARRDEGFCTIFVARGPGGRIEPLVHRTWHAIWHADFFWSHGSTGGPAMLVRHVQLDVGPESLGGPTDTLWASLLSAPAGPTALELDDAALTNFEARRFPPTWQSHAGGNLGL